MNAYITDESAKAYWSAASGPLDVQAPRCRIVSVADAAASIEELKTLSIPRTAIADGRLHLLVDHARNRRNSNHVGCHVCAGELPSGAFRRISPGVVVVSPEFLFVRMARKLTIAELIRLGDELCGTYVDVPSGASPIEREPLTTVRKLAGFIDRAEGIAGAPKARQALAHVVEMSNSPMETVLEMLLCLPCRYGGYGIPKPVMNRQIVLAESERRSSGHSYFKCDLYWEERRCALEYYGRDWHTGVAEVANDVRRESDLKHHGVDVFVATYEQLSSPSQVGVLAAKIARQLDVRLRKPSPSCVDARERLHRELVPGAWAKAPGELEPYVASR